MVGVKQQFQRIQLCICDQIVHHSLVCKLESWEAASDIFLEELASLRSGHSAMDNCFVLAYIKHKYSTVWKDNLFSALTY